MLNTFYFEENGDNRQDIKQILNFEPESQKNQQCGFLKTISIPGNKRKKRILLKKGVEYFSILTENIVLFHITNNVVFAIDHFGKKYLANGFLTQIENELDANIFFRVNRQYIININYVKSFRVYEKVKLKVDLIPTEINNEFIILVSQEKAPAFKKWIAAF